MITELRKLFRLRLCMCFVEQRGHELTEFESQNFEIHPYHIESCCLALVSRIEFVLNIEMLE